MSTAIHPRAALFEPEEAHLPARVGLAEGLEVLAVGGGDVVGVEPGAEVVERSHGAVAWGGGV